MRPGKYLSDYMSPMQRWKYTNYAAKVDCTDLLLQALGDVNNVFTVQISGFRGTKKSLLARDIAFWLKGIGRYSFSVKNIFFSPEEITKYLQGLEDKEKISEIFIRDEKYKTLGLDSYSNITKLRGIFEGIRIKDVSGIIINPFENNFNELDFDIQMQPVAFDWDEKVHYIVCSLRDMEGVYRAKLKSFFKSPEMEAFYMEYVKIKQGYVNNTIKFQNLSKVDMYREYVDLCLNDLKSYKKITKGLIAATLIESGIEMSGSGVDIIYNLCVKRRHKVESDFVEGSDDEEEKEAESVPDDVDNKEVDGVEEWRQKIINEHNEVKQND